MNTSLARLLGSVALVSAATTVAAQGPAGPVVTVTGGQVQGRPLPAPGGAVFKGIPYAAPPVGDLRWRETQPVRPWTGVQQAAEYRDGCGQAPSGSDSANANSEDCLYLNVWAPDWPAGGKKPVMFWINGGELAGGSGALRAGAESLARHGVILVSANYRGTPLGMMGHPELTAESPHKSTAGYGIYDQIAVLKWIKANIDKFGGDPANVTVFGQSGGGHMISMLLASPLTKGLIDKAIIHSGAPMQAVRPYLRKDELERIGLVTAEILKAPKTDQIKYLRSLPAAELVGAMPAVRTRILETTGGAYDQGVDGYAIPRSPADVWIAHEELKVPLMIGSTAHDTYAAVAGEAPLDANASEAETRAWQEKLLSLFYAGDPDLLARALQAYGLRPGPNDVSTYAPYGTPKQQLQVDLNHRCSTRSSAAMHSAVAPTWQFEFTRATPGHPATHSSDLRYVFGYDTLEDDAARRQADLMQRYWTNFAKTGDPNGPGLPAWAKYDTKTRPLLEFADAGPIARSNVRPLACDPYAERYARHPKLLSSGDNLRVRGTGGAR